jgi:hypothetical protein
MPSNIFAAAHILIIGMFQYTGPIEPNLSVKNYLLVLFRLDSSCPVKKKRKQRAPKYPTESSTQDEEKELFTQLDSTVTVSRCHVIRKRKRGISPYDYLYNEVGQLPETSIMTG